MNCPNCNEPIENGMRFCSNCGSEVPLEKKCIKCGISLSLNAKFCPSCGTNQEGNGSATSFMGDKNVIAGDVVSNTNLNTTNNSNTTNTTNNIINNTDETKQVQKCHVCGRHFQIIDGFECPKCHLPTCKDCYDIKNKCCSDCAPKTVAVQTASVARIQPVQKTAPAESVPAVQPKPAAAVPLQTAASKTAASANATSAVNSDISAKFRELMRARKSGVHKIDLVSYDKSSELKLIKYVIELRKTTKAGGISISEARSLIQSCPCTLIRGLDESYALEIYSEIKKACSCVLEVVDDSKKSPAVSESIQIKADSDFLSGECVKIIEEAKRNSLSYSVNYKGGCRVVLKSFEASSKLNLLKCVRTIKDLGMAESRAFIESCPCTLIENLNESAAGIVCNEISRCCNCVCEVVG